MTHTELWDCASDKLVLLGHAICDSEEMKLVFHVPTKTAHLLFKDLKTCQIKDDVYDQHYGSLSFDSLSVFGGYTILFRDRTKVVESSPSGDSKNLLN
jgi:hypothetical protein